LSTQFSIAHEKSTSKNLSSSFCFERNKDKPQNIRLNYSHIRREDIKDNSIEITNAKDNSVLDRSVSNIEQEEVKPLKIYIKFSKLMNNKIVQREEKTNLASRSLVDVRENVKEMLRQSIEKDNSFINQEKKDHVLEKAKNRFDQTEKVQSRLRLYINKPKVRVDEYYKKYVE
jgi:hypothetical protein